jgi:hypothetical protein
MTAAGDLTDAVAFDEPEQSAGAGGVVSTIWTERLACRAQFTYSRGSEAVEAARLEGRPIYKVRVRQCNAARQITTDWRWIASPIGSGSISLLRAERRRDERGCIAGRYRCGAAG